MPRDFEKYDFETYCKKGNEKKRVSLTANFSIDHLCGEKITHRYRILRSGIRTFNSTFTSLLWSLHNASLINRSFA